MKINQLQTAQELEKAFIELGGFLFRYVYVRIRDRQSAEDIVQEAFIKAWKYRKDFDNKKASLKTWLFKITNNTMIDFLRKQKRRREDSLQDETEGKERVEKDIEEKDSIRFIFDKMKNLENREQEMLFLRYKEGLSLKEISEMLDMNYSATKVAIHRAIKKLREICKSDERFL